jgi:hypothetical protein
MRAIRTAIKMIVPLTALMAVMAIPSVASASPAYWGEFDYDPIGGTPTSEDPVTVDFTGTIGIYQNQGVPITATCNVSGEARLANDWDSPSGTPAGQRILSLTPSGCTGSYQNCSLTDIDFQALPWAGSTEWPGLSDFAGVDIEIEYCNGGRMAYAAGSLIYAVPYANGFGQGDCIEGFDLDSAEITGTGFFNSAQLSGQLEFDLGSLEGLSTDEGGPCVTLNEA